jgi:hypothetical protein
MKKKRKEIKDQTKRKKWKRKNRTEGKYVLEKKRIPSRHKQQIFSRRKIVVVYHCN